MPFCTQCGNAVSRDHRFCAHCGAALSAREPRAISQRDSHEGTGDERIETRDTSPGRQSGDPEVDHDVTRSHPGSVLWSAGDLPRTPEGSDRPAARRMLLTASILLMLALSSFVIFQWWFSRQESTNPSAGAEATEQLVEPEEHARGRPPSADERVAATGGARADHTEPAGGGAWTLLAESTRDTASASEALGPADNKAAEIAPGGTLAVGYVAGKYFYDGSGADVEIYSPEGGRPRYRIFARQDAGAEWIRFDINRRGFPNGTAAHDMGHHGIERARQIMIRNDAATVLYIDAVRPLHSEPASHDQAEARGHQHRR